MSRTIYSVKELFYTLQGEGANAGRAAVFCRFAGCNLWTGLEKDRSEAICTFCDTDFVGTDGENGAKYKGAEVLATKAFEVWSENTQSAGKPLIVCTGGEPLLQLDVPLIKAFQNIGFEVAVETNGSLPAPEELDWICVSPKSLDHLVQKSGHELKLVYPQAEIQPEDMQDMDFKHYFLQPMDGLNDPKNKMREENTALTLDYCRKHPKWRISLQTHKILDIP